MAIEHKDIEDAELHELKGAAAASAGKVPIADGAGSTDFDLVGLSSLDVTPIYADIEAKIDAGTIDIKEKFTLSAVIPDVSTPAIILVPIRPNCTFKFARLTLGAAISVANAVVSFKDASGNSQGSNVTVLFTSSAQGDGYTFTATTNNNLTGPTYLKIETDGGSTDAAPVYITLEFEIPI